LLAGAFFVPKIDAGLYFGSRVIDEKKIHCSGAPQFTVSRTDIFDETCKKNAGIKPASP
jgi:hypothetical protein